MGTVMAIEALSVSDCDKQLQNIVSDIQAHLCFMSHHWLFYVFAKPYFRRCCHSWLHVSGQFRVFLKDPKKNYSMLMTVLDHELDRFSPYTVYYKKLYDLKALLRLGPAFTITKLYFS